MQGLLIFTIVCFLIPSPRAFAYHDNALPYSRNDAIPYTHGMNKSASMMNGASPGRGDVREVDKLISVKRRKLLQTYAYASSVYTISFVGCYYDCSPRIFSIYSNSITPLQCADYARASGFSQFGMEFPGRLYLRYPSTRNAERKQSSELVYAVCISEGRIIPSLLMRQWTIMQLSA